MTISLEDREVGVHPWFHRQRTSDPVVSAANAAAEALQEWDRGERPTDVHSAQEQLLRALRLIGDLIDLVGSDPYWHAEISRRSGSGHSLADAIHGYRWACDTRGGLASAAQLTGSPFAFAVWCDEPWWLPAADLDPLYSRELAGRSASELVRDVLAAVARAVSRDSAL